MMTEKTTILNVLTVPAFLPNIKDAINIRESKSKYLV